MLRWVARVALGVILSMCVAGSAMAADEPWRDASQPPGQRADELLAAMTHDQKIAMALGDFASLASLGVPTLPSDDGPSGIRADGTTSLPSAQTLAATFDRSLARAYGETIGAEARGKGFNWWLGPAMDIARTPLAGRQPENLGEDPFLAGETVAQEVTGAKSNHVIATLKHYVANNAEWGRIGFNTPTGRQGNVNALVSERALQEIYEAPFKRAIRESTADAVMCSYNRLNGPQTCESSALLSDLKASGFAGFVAPDFIFAVKDPLAATLAGLDVPALGGRGRAHGRHVHLRSGAGRAAGRHRPAHALRDVRLGRLRRPARAGGRERQHARAPGAGDEGVGGRHGAAQERPPRPAARRPRAALARRHRPLGRRRGLHQRRLVSRDTGSRRHRHAAGRDPRAGRVRRERHRGAGLAG